MVRNLRDAELGPGEEVRGEASCRWCGTCVMRSWPWRGGAGGGAEIQVARRAQGGRPCADADLREKFPTATATWTPRWSPAPLRTLRRTSKVWYYLSGVVLRDLKLPENIENEANVIIDIDKIRLHENLRSGQRFLPGLRVYNAPGGRRSRSARGDVAQMVERMLCMHQVLGSMPSISNCLCPGEARAYFFLPPFFIFFPCSPSKVLPKAE